MKRLYLFFLFSYILYPFLIFSQTIYHVRTTGNNVEAGTSYETAWETINYAATSGGVIAGDTVVVYDGIYNEIIQPTIDGSKGSPIVFIDSLRYFSGVDSTNPPCQWDVIVDGTTYAINLDEDNYLYWIGFEFRSGSTILVKNDDDADYNVFFQCKMNTYNQDPSIVLALEGQCDIISCFISTEYQIQNYGVYFCNTSEETDTISLINNTIVEDAAYGIFFDVNSGNHKAILKNNIIYHATTSTTYEPVWITNTDWIEDFDYNFYAVKYESTDNDKYYVGGFLTFENYVSALRVYDGDAETNGFEYFNTELIREYSLGAIDTNSLAYDAGADLGYGTSIGYYQGNFTDSLGTVWFVHTEDGDAGNGGTSFIDAKQDLDELDWLYYAGDTIVVAGDDTDGWSPTRSGGGNYYITVMDSFRYVNGYKKDLPDTVWSASFTMTGTSNPPIDFGALHNYELIGLEFNCEDGITIDNHSFDMIVNQCRFTGTSGYEQIYLGGEVDGDVEISSNLFQTLSDYMNTGVNYEDYRGHHSLISIINNTFVGKYDDKGHIETNYDPNMYIRNNLFLRIGPNGFNEPIWSWFNEGDYSKLIWNCDYNCMYDEEDNTTNFWENWDVIGDYRTGMSDYTPEGMTLDEHSVIGSDPQIQDSSGVAYILDSSPCYDTGEDLGYGTSIGYYQLPSVTNAGVINIIMFDD